MVLESTMRGNRVEDGQQTLPAVSSAARQNLPRLPRGAFTSAGSIKRPKRPVVFPQDMPAIERASGRTRSRPQWSQPPFRRAVRHGPALILRRYGPDTSARFAYAKAAA